MTPVRKLLLDLVRVSEKASLIAQACRKEDDLFSLLIEEKSTPSLEKSSSAPDFKTLADVLIQEMIKHELEKVGLRRDRVRGEENNEFTNTLGDSITVQVQESEGKTAQLLETVLDGHSKAASTLARLVHTESVHLDPDLLQDIGNQVPMDLEIETERLALWLDPIDSTSNYIRGTEGSTCPISAVAPNGLSVVTVLLGVHDITSGEPLLGIINCPFVNHEPTGWTGRVFWGLSLSQHNLHNIIKSSSSSPGSQSSSLPPYSIVCGNKEGSPLVHALEKKGFKIVRAQGAGYKILVVALGLVDFYICSKATTNKWDTCAGQGILSSLGGGIVEFLGDGDLNNVEEVAEVEGPAKWRNANGIIAYRDKAALHDLQLAIHEFLSNQNPQNP